ncbi:MULTISPECIES: hypothetical protein [Bacteria]|uniref:Uncharacterized protein n=1 Tax=Microbacterium phage Min1 TaxID=446529 RepID=A6N1Z1_9CAUD|nr:hypothetical protein MPMin1_gp33 [Microbacterium phage Min1]ABR10463.1 hypothetical protein [Microbacterium phage Min1]
MSRDRAYYLITGIAMMLGFVTTRGMESFWDGIGWGLGVGAVAAFVAAWFAGKRETTIRDAPSE